MGSRRGGVFGSPSNGRRRYNRPAPSRNELLQMMEQEDSHAIAILAISISESLPGFAGNRAIIAPHYDIDDDIPCVIAGTRKFSVFPPDQFDWTATRRPICTTATARDSLTQ